jgi:hypothetical protein
MAFLFIWSIVSVGCILAIPDRHGESWAGRIIRSMGYGFAVALLVVLLNSLGCSGGGGSGEYRFSS